MEKLLKKRTAFRELSSIIVFIVSKKRNAAIRAIGNPITNSNTLTRVRPIKNVLPVTRSSHAIINEFRIKFILKKEKKMERREISREGGKENDDGPYGTMALFPAITRPPCNP